MYLIAHPSKNVNALELCRHSSFSIAKSYFHHRLPLFLLLQSSEHRSVFERKVSSQVTFHFHCYFCHMVSFVTLHVYPGTQSSGCGRSFQYHSSPTFALCERFCTSYCDPISPAVYSLKSCLFKRDQSSSAQAFLLQVQDRALAKEKEPHVKTGLKYQIPSRINAYGSCLCRVDLLMSKRDMTFLLL